MSVGQTDIVHHCGHRCKFLSKISEEFYCKECGDVARDLTMTMCCFTHFCKDYIVHLSVAGKPCPNCGEENYDTLDHRRYREAIMELEVCCTMKVRGCRWTGKLRDLQAHIDVKGNNCQHIDIDCSNECGELVQRCDMDDHLEHLCQKRQIECRYCGEEGTCRYIINEHSDICEQVEIPCPNSCMVGMIKRGKCSEHLKTCPYEQINCQIRGCSGRFFRADSDKHKENNTHRHIELLSSALKQMENTVSEREADFSKNITKSNEQNATLKQELLHSQVEVQKLREEMKDELKTLTERFEKQLQVYSQQAALLAGDSPYFFSISSFKERKLNNITWFSPPMHILNGPRFNIAVLPNGPPSITDQGCVSVALYVLNGEYDDIVNWPVTARITVELRNQLSNIKHHRIEREFRLELPSNGRERIGYFGSSSNTVQFIPHCSLNFDTRTQIQFLKNDTLHFLVSIKAHSDVYRKRVH